MDCITPIDQTIVAKFGGSSLADAACIRKSAEIILSDTSRKFLVVSAPGKRFSNDQKITDLLIQSIKSPSSVHLIADRFHEIIQQLHVNLDITNEINDIYTAASNGNVQEITSRGEYILGKIMACYLGWDFIDPKDCILFSSDGVCQWDISRTRLQMHLHPYSVIPGFYGADSNGNIVTFLRGGSDITGALVADAVNADLYENWTDVNGVLSADPCLVHHPATIPHISYDELRIMSHYGAGVIHEDTMLPLFRKHIPMLIRNTNAPSQPGTRVTIDGDSENTSSIIGISCNYLQNDKTDQCLISLIGRSSVLSLQNRIISVLSNEGIQYQIIPVQSPAIPYAVVSVSKNQIPHIVNLLYSSCF